MRQNIGYHTRLYIDNSVKVTGGSFGGSIDLETVERLSRLFTVTVKPSGTPVFVDREGREVRLYLSVDCAHTEKGREAIKAWRAARHAEEVARLGNQAERDALIDEITSDLSITELRKLAGKGN